MPSIHARLLLAASLVLAAFLGITGWALDTAFRHSSDTALRERLMGQVYALLAAAQEDEHGLPRLPDQLPDPRLNNPDSGLYAQLVAHDGSYRWTSASTLGRQLDLVRDMPPGVSSFEHVETGGQPLAVLRYGIAWEDFAGRETWFGLAVATNLDAHRREIRSFRATLWGWLGAAAALLLLAQGGVLRWGLSPLRVVARRLQQIEAGELETLDGNFPRELRGLTRNIDSLVGHSRATQERYRNRLADLAHSLKTPLAVLQGALERDDAAQLRAAVGEAVPRIDELVRYHLDRAAVAGRSSIARRVPLEPIADKIIASLQKVYAGKRVQVERQIEGRPVFRGDEGDLYELLGNLLDNAFKHCRARVRLGVRVDVEPGRQRARLMIQVTDDGSGVPPSAVSRVLERGGRADESVPGHGIGLSVVAEIAKVYEGGITIDRDARLGGASVTVSLTA